MSNLTTGANAAQLPTVPALAPLDYAKAYVAALTGDTSTVCDIRLLHDTAKGVQAVPLRGTVADLWPRIEAHNTQGFGAFMTVHATDGEGVKGENITAPRAVWVDLDGDDAEAQYQAAAAFDPPPSFAVSSSPGRWHVYWIVPPECSLVACDSINRRLVSRFNGDRAATDRARVLRLPGTVNHKRDDGHLVTCRSLPGFGKSLTVDQLEAALADIPEHGGTGERHELGDPTLAAPSLGDLQRALDLSDPNEMDRRAWIAFMAGWKQAGWTLTDPGTLYAMWSQFCARYHPGTDGADGKPLANNEAENLKQWASIRATELGWPTLVRTIPSLKADPNAAFGDGPIPLPPGASATPIPTPANDDKPRSIDARNLFIHVLDGDDDPVSFHIDQLVPEDGLVDIYGEPKGGKTFVAIDMGASVATETPFHGHTTMRGTVFYICGEGFRAIKRRFKAWEAARGVSLDGAPLFRSQCAVQMLDAASAAMLRDAVDAMAARHGPPRLIIIDTLARNFGPGDENSTVDMARFIAALDALRVRYAGCTVIVVHHSGVAEKGRARGSSALLGAVDAEYRVEKKDGKPTLYNTAMKDAPPAPAMQFEFVEAAGSVALKYVGEPTEKGETLPPMAQLALETFNTVEINGRVDVSEWRALFYERHSSDKTDTKKSAFRNARKILVDGGHLQLADDGKNYRRPPMPGQMPDR